jgi:MoaA/NifB/PqqE/SkfB family radical SAM enzyme
MRSNIADLPQLPALATRLGALQILVSNVVPHTPEMEREILYRDALTACAYRASRWAPELSLPRIDLGSEVIAPVSAVFRSRASISLLGTALSERTDFCPFVEQGYAAVRWDGEVAPCLSLLHDHPEYIRGRRKWVAHHSFGNIAQLTLRDIWQSMDFCEFRERLCRFHFSPCTTCGGCERFPYNLEDCIGNGFPTCGGCLWSQGFVQCA